MKLTEANVRRFLAEKDARVVTYDDFNMFSPPGKSGGHWLHGLKKILVKIGWGVHEVKRKAEWDNCGYGGSKTHFHEPSSF